MRTYRTVLEQKIRERRQTFEEFAASAEKFAREHNEPGTISVRHLQRLAAGRRSDGRPLGPVQPATARLLEHIFGLGIDDLLAPPAISTPEDHSEAELRQMLNMASRIDGTTIATLQDQLSGIRRLDRQLGAVVAHDEVLTKIGQVTSLLAHSLSNGTSERLAALLSELCCLAGWQALDLGKVNSSWRHYEQAKTAALQSSSAEFAALAGAGHAFVLADIGDTKAAVEVIAETRQTADSKCSRLIRSWLAAAHGEMLASDRRHDESLHAFDNAALLLPCDTAIDPSGPYIALDPIHLARWRGNALARFADTDAVDVLANALDQLDTTFVRAETALRVDLTTALAAIGEPAEARDQARRAKTLAIQIGSARQQRRLKKVAAQDHSSQIS